MPVQDTYRLLLLLALSLAGVTAQNATVAKGNATNPTMSILDGHLHFQVPKNMDVTFSRTQDEETVTMWQLKGMLDELVSTTLPAVEARVRAHAKTRLADAQQNVLKGYRSRAQAMAATVAASVQVAATADMETSEMRLAEMRRQLEAYKGRASDAINSIRGTLRSRLTAASEEAQRVVTELAERGQRLQELQQEAASSVQEITQLGQQARTSIAAVGQVYEAEVVAAASKFTTGVAEAENIDNKRKLETKMYFVPVLNQGCDNCQIASFQFQKAYSDTALRLGWSGDARLIGNGQIGVWSIRVNGQDCRCPDNSVNCAIQTKFHASQNLNVHRTLHLEGICFKTAGAAIGRGTHTVSLHVASNGDAYTAWAVPSRFWATETDEVTSLIS